MDERGQSTLESLMIAATAFSLVAVGLAFFKDSQPRRWNDLTAAVSDVSRDIAWQLDDDVAAWKGNGTLRASLASAEVPRPEGRTYLRRGIDPLEQVRALR